MRIGACMHQSTCSTRGCRHANAAILWTGTNVMRNGRLCVRWSLRESSNLVVRKTPCGVRIDWAMRVFPRNGRSAPHNSRYEPAPGARRSWRSSGPNWRNAQVESWHAAITPGRLCEPIRTPQRSTKKPPRSCCIGGIDNAPPPVCLVRMLRTMPRQTRSFYYAKLCWRLNRDKRTKPWRSPSKSWRSHEFRRLCRFP